MERLKPIPRVLKAIERESEAIPNSVCQASFYTILVLMSFSCCLGISLRWEKDCDIFPVLFLVSCLLRKHRFTICQKQDFNLRPLG